MLATMGYITAGLGDGARRPGYCSSNLKFTDIPSGLAALKVVPFAGWEQMFLYAGNCEF
jgi:hypothetical protein